MLDVAWGLFDVRMLQDADRDPNAVWTDITSRYLNIVPHPELSWWAVRAQLVESPGYMVTYALGAALTADLRARTVAAIGPFDAGNPRWYGWLAQSLLGEGSARPPRELLAEFLGRAPSTDAIVSDIARASRD
jgi:Zn-dependent M32 family carboxypeptidase